MLCYNYGLFLSQSIESILQQSFKDFEFIIIDDGSIDNSVEIIRGYSDPRVVLIQLKKNRGNYKARNIGISKAKGKYICVMDADDVANHNRFKIQYDYMQKYPYIGCIGSQSMIIDSSGTKIGQINRPLSYSVLKTYLLKDNFMTHPTLMIRRNLLSKHNIFYNEALPYTADYDFVVRLAQISRVKNLPERLINYRIHNEQISTIKRNKQSQIADIIPLKQLNVFNVKLNNYDRMLYLRLMKEEPLRESELFFVMNILNKLLDKNHSLKFFSERNLFLFFKKILNTAEYNSKWDGWSIEKVCTMK